MQISVLLQAVLLLGLMAVLLAEEVSPVRGRRAKKEGALRSPAMLSKPNRGSRVKTRKMCVIMDSATIKSSSSVPVSPSQSVSPWTYEVSYDPARIPSHIFEAKCEKRGCLTKEGRENTGLESKPVYYEILVLRRVKGRKNKYSLQLEKKTISVGCTCVLPNVISQM